MIQVFCALCLLLLAVLVLMNRVRRFFVAARTTAGCESKGCCSSLKSIRRGSKERS